MKNFLAAMRKESGKRFKAYFSPCQAVDGLSDEVILSIYVIFCFDLEDHNKILRCSNLVVKLFQMG